MAPSVSRFIAVPTIALLSLGALSGCVTIKTGTSGDESSSPAATSSASSSSSASASESSASASASVAMSSAPAAGATVQAQVPNDFRRINALTNDISFAVPATWQEISGADIADDAKLTAFLEEISADARPSKELVQSQSSGLDLLVLDMFRNDDGFVENLFVGGTPVKLAALPSEEELRQITIDDGNSPEKYEVVATPLGSAVKQSYTRTEAGVTIYGAFLVVPSPTGASNYSRITLSTTKADRRDEVVAGVLGSLQQVVK